MADVIKPKYEGIAVIAPHYNSIDSAIEKFAKEKNFGLVSLQRILNSPDENFPKGLEISITRENKKYVSDTLLINYIEEKLSSIEKLDKKVLFYRIPTTPKQLELLSVFVDLNFIIEFKTSYKHMFNVSSGKSKAFLKAFVQYTNRSKKMLELFPKDKTFTFDMQNSFVAYLDILETHDNFYK